MFAIQEKNQIVTLRYVFLIIINYKYKGLVMQTSSQWSNCVNKNFSYYQPKYALIMGITPEYMHCFINTQNIF